MLNNKKSSLGWLNKTNFFFFFHFMPSQENSHDASRVLGSPGCVGCGIAVGAVFWRAASRGLLSDNLFGCVCAVVCLPCPSCGGFALVLSSIFCPEFLHVASHHLCGVLKLSAVIINCLLRYPNRAILCYGLTLMPFHSSPPKNEFEHHP